MCESKANATFSVLKSADYIILKLAFTYFSVVNKLSNIGTHTSSVQFSESTVNIAGFQSIFFLQIPIEFDPLMNYSW